MSRAVSPSSGTVYGLARVCRIWGVSRATVHRHLSPARPEPSRRPGPVGPMPDAALLEATRATLTGSPFHGEGHRKVWARLRHKGVRTSKRRVLRLMRDHDLLAPSRVGAPRGLLPCVERCCPRARQARRSETVSTVRTCSMQAHRRAGLRRILVPPPAGSACRA
ncbi:hypothetical protein GMJLKIPL_3154 [Methylobacterium isbiliense]|uniref:HTH-like domain-containing protein n=1 Tax=Methylobacterium isbiliense TaxID=315478 RepID=A0ABQ4SFE3_9HYPH|nr:hypothetical protein GMJLKIPL_3154 [Methylobacterium isbiliense]